MKILVDADACPVVDETIACAQEIGVEVLLVCDSAHELHREGARTLTVVKAADSADFRLVNLVEAGDVVVTQDYGLAAMAMARGGRVLHQNGLRYTEENIDALLASRHAARKIRMAGGRVRGPAKRTPAQDAAFRQALWALLNSGAKLENR